MIYAKEAIIEDITLIRLFLIGAGLLSILRGVMNWGFVTNSRRSQLPVFRAGVNIARVFYIGLGIFSIFIALLLM